MKHTNKTTTEQTSPDRTLRMLQHIDPTGHGMIRITERVKGKIVTSVYDIVTFAAYEGATGITWIKEDGERYNTCIQGKKSTCDCPWGCYGAHKKPCKHVSAGLKLQEIGELLLPMTEDNEDSDADCYDLAALSWDLADCYYWFQRE